MTFSSRRRRTNYDGEALGGSLISMSIIAAIVLSGLILGALAITIVLSLIPTFTSNHGFRSIQNHNRGKFISCLIQ